MTKRLLDRQVDLLDYLTSVSAIFGDGDEGRQPDLLGIDRALLRLEARFSHEKRMAKIAAVFRRTLEMLGSDQDRMIRRFVESCPPLDISRLSNARQFLDFLSAQWQREEPDPPYLPDIAACELACAEVRAKAEDTNKDECDRAAGTRPGWIRRRPEIALLRCAYDIRSVFEQGAKGAVPRRHDTPIGVAMPRNSGQPQVFELAPAVFDLLAALDDWIDPVSVDSSPEAGVLIADLAEHGLVEVRE